MEKAVSFSGRDFVTMTPRFQTERRGVSNSLLPIEEVGHAALQEIKEIYEETIRKTTTRNTMRLERMSVSSVNTPTLRSPRASTPSSSTGRRAHRRSLDSNLSSNHVSMVDVHSFKPHMVSPLCSNNVDLTLPNIPSSMFIPDIDIMSSSRTICTIIHDSSRETFSPSAEEAIAGLGLDHDGLKFLKMNFNLIDSDGNGMIDKKEFLAALQETNENGDIINDFTNKVFDVVDVSGDGGIDFDEFIRMSATFCMFSYTDLTRYVYKCYNKKGDNMFVEQDFLDLNNAINASTQYGGPRKWSDVLGKYDKVRKIFSYRHLHLSSFSKLSTLFNGLLLLSFLSSLTIFLPYPQTNKGYISEADFLAMTRGYPQLVYFANRLQAKMRQRSLGEVFYMKILERQQRARAFEDYKRIHDGVSNYLLLPPPLFPLPNQDLQTYS